MRPHRVTDLRWVVSGDLVIGANGDLGDTRASPLLSFIQEIQTRVRSELYDWKLHPHLGASLSDLIGEINNKNTAEDGKARIMSALVRDSFITAGLIKITYLPVDQNHLMYRLRVNVPDMTKGEFIQINLILDTNEFEIIFI
jgi:hypothetical protein